MLPNYMKKQVIIDNAVNLQEYKEENSPHDRGEWHVGQVGQDTALSRQ